MTPREEGRKRMKKPTPKSVNAIKAIMLPNALAMQLSTSEVSFDSQIRMIATEF